MTTAKSNNHPDTLFAQATQYHQENDLEKACILYERTLEIIPDSPLVNYNFGLALYEQGKYEESIEKYYRALESAPDNTDVLFNLAISTKHIGDYENCVRLYKKILKITPDDIDSLYNLGCCFNDMHKDFEAISTFKKTLKLFPEHQSAINNLAYLYHKHDNDLKAIKFYTLLLSINPDHGLARHMLSSLKGEKPKSAPPEYVQNIFDNYSNYYEDSLLNKLEYNVPTNLRKSFDELFKSSLHSFDTLDLGCGTGLAGEAFKDLSRSLSGIDISQKMIDIATAKGIYDSLSPIGIEEYLNTVKISYDLYISADVFIYIGELEAIFKLVAKSARPGALFCFSTEKCYDNDFELRKTGRFAHSESYIKQISCRTGWEIVKILDVDLRKEKNKWLTGILCFLKKTGSGL